MLRVLAALVAFLLAVSLGVTAAMAQMPKTEPAQPKSMEKMGHKVEGTIKAVRGTTVTLEDGTQLSIPASVKVSKDQLKPGAQISAEYEERGGQKVATSVQIKG